MGLLLTLGLTVLIIALVYGFDRRCAAAVSGSFLGILVTCVLALVFTEPLPNPRRGHGLFREPALQPATRT